MCRGIPEHTERPEQRRSLERCRKPGILDSESSRAQRRAARFPLHSRRGLCRDFRTTCPTNQFAAEFRKEAVHI